MSHEDGRHGFAGEFTLHGVLAEYIRRREAGESVDIESFCASYPDLADGLRSYAEGEGLLDALSDRADVDSGDLRSAETMRPGGAQRTDFAPQSQFGRYWLVHQLGKGAMGTVYLAEDTQLDRRVALKIPKGTGTDGEEFLKRFTREAQAAARLEHPNLCRIYDAGDVNGTPFISMEYIDGPPLSQCVGTAAYHDERRIVEIVKGIASGLQAAHERGILHRDVKSGNVLMQNGDTPCVTDFGLARIQDRQESKLTHEGALLGTPAYMAPEQIRSELDRIGPHSDVYALGVVFYELLTGRIPFQGSTLVVLNQALQKRPRPLKKLRPDVDPELADFCLRMLEKEPERRPQSMKEVVDFLQSWLKNNSTEDRVRQSKEAENIAKCESMKSNVVGLIQRGQHAQAVAAMEKMQKLQGPGTANYVAWARNQLPEVKKLPRRLQAAVPSLLATAKQSIVRKDYGQAAQLLQEIPPDFRSAEVQKTLDNAVELQEESDLLLLSLQECVRTRQLEGIEDNLKRFLQLKPGNKFARELREAIRTYAKVPLKQRRYQFDKSGQLQPRSSGSIWDNWLLIGALCFCLVCGTVYLGVVFYLKHGSRTLAVEVNDAWLEDQKGELSLSVDDDEYTLTGPGMEVTVTLGEHGFSVRNGETIVHNPQTFTIEKGTRPVLHIDASGMRLANRTQNPADHVAEGGAPGSSGANASQPVSATEFEFEEILSYEFTELEGQDLHANGLVLTGKGAETYLSMGKYIYKFDDDETTSPVLLSDRGGAYDMDITSDGRYVLLARAFGRVEVWTTEPWEMKQRLEFSDSSGQATALCVSPDGRWIGAVMMRGRAAVWELETGRLVAEIPIEFGDPWHLQVVFSTDSRKLIVVAAHDGGRSIYEIAAESGEVDVKRCDGIPGGGSIVMGADDRAVIACWEGQPLYAVNSRTWQDAQIIGSGGNRRALAWSPDSALIAAATNTNDGLALFDGTTYRWLKNLSLDGFSVERVSFSWDSRILAVSGVTAVPESEEQIPVVRVWRLSERAAAAHSTTAPAVGSFAKSPLPDGPPGFLQTLDGHTGIITGLEFAADGKTLATVSAVDQSLRIWDLETGTAQHVIDVGIAYGLSIDNRRQRVAVSCAGEARLYELETGDMESRVTWAGNVAYASAFSPDGNRLAVHIDGGGVKIYDVSASTNPRLEFELPGADGEGWAGAMRFLPDGEHLLVSSPSTEYATKLFHLPTRREVRTFRSRSDDGGTVSYTLGLRPDGEAVVLVANESWQLMQFDLFGELQHQTYRVWGGGAVVFAPDGRNLVSLNAGEGQTILQVRSADTGSVTWEAKLPARVPSLLGGGCLDITPDGRFAASGRKVDESQNSVATNEDVPNPILLWRLPEEVWLR